MKVEKKLKFTFLITDRDEVNKIINYLKEKGIDNYFSFYGKGSASSSLLEYLGIGEVEKDILIYPSNESDACLIMESLKNSDHLKNTIVFRVPVKGISSMKSLNYLLKEEEDDE